MRLLPLPLRLAGLALAAALAACSSDSNNLLDSGPAPFDAPEDLAVDDAPADVAQPPADRAADVADAADVTATDAPRDAADATADVADATADVALDTPLDVRVDVAPDSTADVAPDVVADARADVAVDAPADVAVDVGCGARVSCSGRCVDTQTDVSHCGDCATTCAAPANAAPSCAAGRCGYTCVAGFHLCGGACASDAAVATCGASCSPCEARPNASATCEGTACRYACAAGFADCDGLPANGCERPVSADVSNCGACGRVCPGVDTDCQRRTCAGGTCGSANTPSGTRTAAQTPRDCRAIVCNGAGATSSLPDDTDLPVDSNPCTDDVCAGGVATNPATPAGRSCGTTQLCDGAGACVGCVRNSDCASGVCAGGRCQTPSCTDGVRNGLETGVDCGGACPVCPALLVLGGGSSAILAGSFEGGAWNTTTLAGRTVDGVSVAVTARGDGVGLLRFTALDDPMDNRLRYTVWRGGAWRAFADLGPTVTTQGPPSLASAPGGAVIAAFHGFDYNHYFASFDGTTWSPAAESTGASGARAGAIALSGANPLLVYARGLANELYSRERSATWGGDQLVDPAATFDAAVSPTAVNLTPAQVLAVWTAPGGQVRHALRAAGTWSAAANVPTCTSSARVALAALSTTQAVMAFRGADGNLYASFYTAGAWSAPARVAAGVTGAPAVARGLGSVAEVAFIVGGVAQHARYSGTAWSAPAPIGGAGLVSVALASGP